MRKKQTQTASIKKSNANRSKISDTEIDKKAEKNSVEKTKVLERIVNRSPAVAFLWRAEENWPVEFVSENICQFGYKAEDFLSGKLLFSQLIHPDDLLQVSQEVLHYSSTFVNEFTQEYRILTKEGAIRWIDERTWVLRDEKNKITHYEGLIIDITERKKVEETLAISEEKFAKAFHNSPDIIILTSVADGRIIEVNESLEKITGFSREEFIGKTTAELRMWENPKDRERYVEILMRDQRVIEMEVNFRVKSGEIRNVLLSGEIIQLQNQAYILGVIRDVTEIKKAEKELKNSEKRYRLLFDANPIPMWVYDLESLAFLEVNHAAIINYGYSRAEFLQMTLKDIRPKEELTKLIDNIKRERSDYQYSGEWKHKTKDGSIIDVDIISHRFEYKKRNAVLVMAVNITQRKIAEEELKITHQKVRNIIEYSPSLIYLFDTEGKFIMGNKNFEKLVGFPLKDLVGKSRDQFFTTEVTDLHRSNDLVVIASKKPLYLEEENIETDGTHYYISVKFPLIDSNGKVYAVGGISTDISDRKKAEEEIKTLNTELEKRVQTRTAQLEKINQELKTFSYSVSHDLKAPLRGIDGYSKLLQENYSKELNDEAQLFINNIRKGAHQMSMIIEDLLAYSRLERVEVKKSSVHLDVLIEKIISLNQKEIDDYQIKINQHIPDTFIHADLDAFTIAFRNVFENAIKFTKKQEKPEITIGFQDRSTNWLIFVKDNGIGFNRIYKDKIFEIFQRLHRMEDYEGTGIGLAMVAKAMQRMGGRVWAESDSDGISAGKGAVFYLEIMK
ncbi:MAG: PAS domain S-box protein [Bacteroidales bacterium]|nr:PAS domain S-box protein [Bacteroidales bacterium]